LWKEFSNRHKTKPKLKTNKIKQKTDLFYKGRKFKCEIVYLAKKFVFVVVWIFDEITAEQYIQTNSKSHSVVRTTLRKYSVNQLCNRDRRQLNSEGSQMTKRILKHVALAANVKEAARMPVQLTSRITNDLTLETQIWGSCLFINYE